MRILLETVHGQWVQLHQHPSFPSTAVGFGSAQRLLVEARLQPGRNNQKGGRQTQSEEVNLGVISWCHIYSFKLLLGCEAQKGASA